MHLAIDCLMRTSRKLESGMRLKKLDITFPAFLTTMSENVLP